MNSAQTKLPQTPHKTTHWEGKASWGRDTMPSLHNDMNITPCNLSLNAHICNYQHVRPPSLTWTFPLVLRWIHSHDGSLPSEEEDRLLCDPDISALHHDGHPLPGLLLAQPRVGAGQNCLWCVFHFNILVGGGTLLDYLNEIQFRRLRLMWHQNTAAVSGSYKQDFKTY